MYQETIISNSLICNIKISDGAYRCYLLLESMCYNKDYCFPSIKFLAVALGRSTRTINRYIKELIRYNLIVKRRRGSTSNLYTILAKKTKQVGERVVNAFKKAVAGSKSQNKGKQSTFNCGESRNYNFNALESMLLGREEYNPDKLLLE